MLLTLTILSLVAEQVLTVIYPCDPTAVCGCSTSPASVSRILGGEPALNNTWGWAVSILFNESYFCAGTLISDSWVLTTTNCLRGYAPSEIIVSAATNWLLGGEQWRVASNLIRNPDYFGSKQVNDIGLIQVSPPFNMSDPAIAQICLPMTMAGDDYPPVNSSIVALGWGKVAVNSSASPYLQQVTLRRVAYELAPCYTRISASELQFCASVENGPKGKDQQITNDTDREFPIVFSIEGVYRWDDGGPVMAFTPTRQWVLAGIILQPLGCFDPGCTSIHTRVSAFVAWIQSMNVTGTFMANTVTTTPTAPNTTVITTATPGEASAATATIAVSDRTLAVIWMVMLPLIFT